MRGVGKGEDRVSPQSTQSARRLATVLLDTGGVLGGERGVGVQGGLQAHGAHQLHGFQSCALGQTMDLSTIQHAVVTRLPTTADSGATKPVDCQELPNRVSYSGQKAEDPAQISCHPCRVDDTIPMLRCAVIWATPLDVCASRGRPFACIIPRLSSNTITYVVSL